MASTEEVANQTPSREDVDDVVEVNDPEEASVQAKRETDKLKILMSKSRKSLTSAGKGAKKGLKALKKKTGKKSGKSKTETVPEVVEAEVEPEEDVEENGPTEEELAKQAEEEAAAEAEKAAAEEAAAAATEEEKEKVKSLEENVDKLQQENKDLQSQLEELRTVFEAQKVNMDFTEEEQPMDEKIADSQSIAEQTEIEDDETAAEGPVDDAKKIKDLEEQVKKWQALYLESNNIGPSKVETLEAEYDEESFADKTSTQSTAYDNRVQMLEAQLRESVKVLKSAQKKMIQRHEKEFHLQQTVDDLSEQIVELKFSLEQQKEAEEVLKVELEEERNDKAAVQKNYENERSKVISFKKSLGLDTDADTHVAQEKAEGAEAELEAQKQSSGFLCCASNALEQ